MDFLELKNIDFRSVHLIKFYFFVISLGVIIVGVLINSFEKYLPGFISKTFRYGKQAYKGTTKFKTIEFPKSSFKQFYEVGVLCSIVTYPFVIATYIFGLKVPVSFSSILLYCGGGVEPVSEVSATSVFLAITLMNLQIARRFYDTHFVSIFGEKSRINLTHCFIGITYYPMVIFAILCEAPNFTTSEFQRATWNDLGYTEIFGVTLFFWAWRHQHSCTVILANLRKTKEGIVSDYKIPRGDWFDYLSSPHCNAEILIYIAMTIFLWKSRTWWYILLWVFSNQIETILLSHWWYQDTFKNFPKQRKALIPYIY